MRKAYVKPSIEVERYTLDANIAANCSNIISLGPGTDESGTDACDDYYGAWEIALFSNGTAFYEDGSMQCDCYYSSGGQGYFTS